MVRIGVFAGTTEGRNIVNFLTSLGIEVTACVATEYGETLLKDSNATILCGRMEQQEMEMLLKEKQFFLVIDATHPYAQVVTKHIKQACEHTKTEYLRLLRRSEEGNQENFATIEELVDYLNNTEGNVLLTTGSKELSSYCKLMKDINRLYVRVLPMEESLRICTECGIAPSHVIAMQGPFTEEFNRSLIRMYQIQYLVTKDSGMQGGFREKIDAAKQEGIQALVLGRPEVEHGYSYEETIQYIEKQYSVCLKPKFAILGIGTGDTKLLTTQAMEALKQSDCVLGAKRMVDAVAKYAKHTYCEYAPEKILEFVKNHPSYKRYAIVLSGDISIYSGAKKLREALKDYEVEPICGISSITYFLSRIKESFEDVTVLSLHGRETAFLSKVRTTKKMVVLLSRENTIASVCEKLYAYGLRNLRVIVGERLSYEEERILEGTVEEFRHLETDSLSVAYFENPSYDNGVTCGISDEEWIRGNIPMTKEEVRTVCLSKLDLKKDSILYDIGAGTGSVAIEAGRLLLEGKVYAIEKEAEGVELIKANQKKFLVEQVVPIHGVAPEALDSLETPTHAFLGGTSGNLNEIIEALMKKNKEIRMVLSAVSLETIAEATACLKEYEFLESEVVTISISKSKKLGTHHLMFAQNPITVFTFQHPQNLVY